MSIEQTVALSVEGPVATLMLQRPKQLNALNQQLFHELNKHLDLLEQTPGVRVVMVRGEGKAFAAGADIKELEALDSDEAARFAAMGQQTFTRLENLHCPTIALVQGYALGGGLELAMACDVRIAAKGTKFGQPEVTLGVIPGFGGSQRLPRIVGQGRALSLLLTGDMIDAEGALEMGLVTTVVDGGDLVQTGEKLASKLAKQAPRALHFVKRSVYEGVEVPLNQGMAMEAAWFGLCFSTEDQKEGMAAFAEKRKPDFKGQ